MRLLRALAWVELKLFVREPLTVVLVLALPLVMLYVLNGVFGDQPDPGVWQRSVPIDYYTSAYIVLVAATAGVLSLPVHLAGYREQGVLRRFRASALNPAGLVGAHVVVTMILGTVGAAILAFVSLVAFDAARPEASGSVVVAFVLIASTFSALGALLGFLLPTARAAQGLGVLLFFAFMMLGGAGPPTEVLPTGLSHLADALPVTAAGDLPRSLWMGRGWDLRALSYFLVMLPACLGLVSLQSRWHGKK